MNLSNTRLTSTDHFNENGVNIDDRMCERPHFCFLQSSSIYNNRAFGYDIVDYLLFHAHDSLYSVPSGRFQEEFVSEGSRVYGKEPLRLVSA